MRSQKLKRKTMAGVGHRPEGDEEQKAASARDWLEMTSTMSPSTTAELVESGGFYAPLTLWGLEILRVGDGRALCSFKVPDYLLDSDGNWSAGAIASMIDNVGATAISSTAGEIKISVDFDITYFTPATSQEEVEVEAKLLHNKGKLSHVVVEIRKKMNGEMVAVGRQWMSARHSIRSKI